MPSNDPDREIRDELKEDVKRGLESGDAASVFSRTETLRRLMDRVRFWEAEHRSDMVRDLYDGTIARRDFLKLLGFGMAGATVSATGAGYFFDQKIFHGDGDSVVTGYSVADSSGTADSGEYSRLEGDWERVDLDVDEGDRVDDVIAGQAGDGKLLVVPEGTYHLGDVVMLQGYSDFGIVGDGRVEFTIDAPFNGYIFNIGRVSDCLVENVILNQEEDGVQAGIRLQGSGDFQVRNYHIIGHGRHPDTVPRSDPGDKSSTSGKPDVKDGMLAGATSRDANGLVKAYVAKNAGYKAAYNNGDNRVGNWLGPNHRGEITFLNCNLEDFPNNALYCSRTPGVVKVYGGLYRNNDVSSIRLGSAGSEARGVYVQADASRSMSPNPQDAINTQGVWFEQYLGGRELASGRADDFSEGPHCIGCEFRYVSGRSGYPFSLGLRSNDITRRTSIRDSNIHCTIGNPAIIARHDGGEVAMENVHVTGRGDQPGVDFSRRPGTMTDCCVEWEGATAVEGISGGYTTGGCRSPEDCVDWGPV